MKYYAGEQAYQDVILHVDDLGDSCVYLLKNWNPGEEKAPKTKTEIH